MAATTRKSNFDGESSRKGVEDLMDVVSFNYSFTVSFITP